MKLEVHIVPNLREASLFITSKNYYRRKPQKVTEAEASGLPIYVIKSNSLGEIKQFLESVDINIRKGDDVSLALKEAEDAIGKIVKGMDKVELLPQSAYIRRLQHLVAERSQLASRSRGKEPRRRVEIYRNS